MSTNAQEHDNTCRIDRWLWAARWFKTRGLAVNAINNGRILLNGERPKPAKGIRAGDIVEIRRPPYAWVVTVLGVAEQRVSAKLAAGLYAESQTSAAARETLQQQLKLQAVVENSSGKLNKKERRQREQLKRAHE